LGKETCLRREAGEDVAEGRRVQSFAERVAGLANNECGPGPEGNPLAADSPFNVATDPECPGDASDALERSIVVRFLARVLAIEKVNTVIM
jgi:hypothetical protein